MKTIIEMVYEAADKNKDDPVRHGLITLTNEELERFAALVEAAHTERLLAGVEMPEPDTHCWDSDTESDVWSYSKGQLRETVVSAVLRKDAEIDTLKAENERLRADAARYQWLRSDDIQVPHGVREIYVLMEGLPHSDESNVVLAESDLDAAIDAAMKGQP